MGLILDSSVVITAERKRERVAGFLKRILEQMGNQEAALSAMALVERPTESSVPTPRKSAPGDMIR